VIFKTLIKVDIFFYYTLTAITTHRPRKSTRLAFAVAAHLEPEILLVDLVLVVEDSAC